MYFRDDEKDKTGASMTHKMFDDKKSVNFCRPMELFSRSLWLHKINIVISKFIWNLCNHP